MSLNFAGLNGTPKLFAEHNFVTNQYAEGNSGFYKPYSKLAIYRPEATQ